MPVEYVRFRSTSPNKNGLHVGVFGLVNGLGRNWMLAPDEWRFWRENNDWYDAAFPQPPVYREKVHPRAAAWFKSTASDFLERVPGYLAILDAHRIAWEEVRTTDPGTIIYEDEYQVVAIPVEGEFPNR